MPWTLVLTCSCEKVRLNSTLSIPKNSVQLQTDEWIDQFTQRRVWQRVLHLILNGGGAMVLPKTMRMDPVLVWTTPLDIHKHLRRVPALDFALPGEWDPKEMQPVIDTCPFTQMYGLRRHHLKPQFWWGNAFQVGCLSKEGKNLVTWEWKTHRGRQCVYHR